MEQNPVDWIQGVIVGFVLLILGFFLFPGVNMEIFRTSSVNTTENATGWNPIAVVEHSLLPYVFIGGIFLAVMVALWRKGK